MDEKPGDNRRNHVQSVERCFAVIHAYSDGPLMMSITEVSKRTGLTKATSRRMLLTLEKLGYVAGDGVKFGLTAKVLGFGYAYLSSLNLPAVAQPFLEGLTEELKASTALVTMDGVDVVYLSRVHRHRITGISLPVGARLPAYVTASGRVLLSDISSDRLAEYFQTVRLETFTHATITEQPRLRAELAKVGAQGWAMVDQEFETGLRSAAAPIRDSAGRVIAALSLSCASTGTSPTETVARVIPRLVATASEISGLLGARR